MHIKKIILYTIIAFVCLLIFSIPAASSALSAEPTRLDNQSINDQIEEVVLQAIGQNSNYIQSDTVSSLQVSDIKVSQDQEWATAWVVYYDSQIDAILPTEPALAVVHNVDGAWRAYLPTDPGWQDTLIAVPDDLLTKDEKDMWLAMNQGTEEAFPTQSGYYLPWRGGQTAYLSRSVGHDADFSTAHYSFDFFVPGNTVCPSGGVGDTLDGAGTTGLNFSLYASRAATVWGWDDSVEDCNHSKVNFIVLRNVDDPSIFQLYMHLSQGSIPPNLKVVGAPVARGQFIGLADNTGNSTGSHLHFQIEHQPAWPEANPYWNTALDVTFDDVAINGGRPRVNPPDAAYCQSKDICNTFQPTYISGNYYLGDSEPPTGELNGVNSGQVITTQTISLSGWGTDDVSGLDYGQLIANFDGSWHNLGPHFNPDFSYSWDLCDPSMPVSNGPISLALLLYDMAGNTAPRAELTNIIKNYSCPIPPALCIPDANQVTLFEDPYFRGGCVKFGVGEYLSGQSLNPLGDNDAESILVGENVFVTLYTDENYSGHSQGIMNDIAYMQYDWVPSNSLSSMKVTSRQLAPQTPIILYPLPSTIIREGDVIPFSWRNDSGAIEYQFQIFQGTELYQTFPWQADPFLYVDSLAAGSYSWQIHSRNGVGISQWSAKTAFSIQSPILYPPNVTAPYSDTMEHTESAWVPDGFWTYMTNPTMAHSGTASWWFENKLGDYDDGQPNTGSLTSKPIYIPGAGFYLRYYYRVETETSGINWDQRWVQISVDRGSFHNLVQLSDEPQISETASWMYSKAIDLSAYSGHIIRIRFQLSTLDADSNNYAGWGIDDVSITATPPLSCSDNRMDESPENAYLLAYDTNIEIPGQICPNGDYDFYKFFGHAGDRIVADIDAMVNGSPLDSYLFLLDTDARTVLAENDDEIYATLRDPLLSYTLPEEGTYYLKLKAWKHPLVGGNTYNYTIRLYEDHNAPTLVTTWPPPSIYLPDSVMTLSANISDVTNGVDRLEFYWHSSNWLSGIWQIVGTDRDGSNGWSVIFNPAGQPEGNEGAIFAQVFDMAGNWAGGVMWNLGIDKTAPTTSMSTLASTQPSNAFLLSWTGTDNLSGIDYVEIQQKNGSAAWTTFPTIDGSFTKYWIIENAGNTYSYRMHGVDRSGNSENYPSTAETTTSIPEANVLCYAPDIFDISGNDDNSYEHASQIFVDGASQVHNFCNPLPPNFQNDEDWVKFSVLPGQQILIKSVITSLPTATVISLYAQDGHTLLAEATPAQFGNNTLMLWTSDREGSVYIRLRHLDGRVFGSKVGSTLTVKTVETTFLPVVIRK